MYIHIPTHQRHGDEAYPDEVQRRPPNEVLEVLREVADVALAQRAHEAHDREQADDAEQAQELWGRWEERERAEYFLREAGDAVHLTPSLSAPWSDRPVTLPPSSPLTLSALVRPACELPIMLSQGKLLARSTQNHPRR